MHRNLTLIQVSDLGYMHVSIFVSSIKSYMMEEHMKNKTIADDMFMKFLIAICYVFMIIALIASVTIGITTQEFISFLGSLIVLAMFGLLLIFFTIVLFAYDTALKQKEKHVQSEKMQPASYN